MVKYSILMMGQQMGCEKVPNLVLTKEQNCKNYERSSLTFTSRFMDIYSSIDLIIGYKNILIVTGGKELNCCTKMRAVTREVIKKSYR